MITRHSGRYLEGYYLRLNSLSTADFYEEYDEKKKQCSIIPKRQKFFANSVNKFIKKSLKKNFKIENEKRWSKQTFEITKPLQDSLKEKYMLNQRFKSCELISDLNLINSLESSKTNTYYVKKENFQVKLNKQKLQTYYNEEGESKQFLDNPSITIQMKRERKRKISDTNINFLKNFHKLTKKIE